MGIKIHHRFSNLGCAFMLEHPYFCAADICWNLTALKILFKKALEKALENKKKKIEKKEEVTTWKTRPQPC